MLSNLKNSSEETNGLHVPPQQQHTPFITVMFTAISNSVSHAARDDGQDISPHRDQLLSAIKKHHGVSIDLLDNPVGNRSASYFNNVLDAVRAAANIQQDLDTLNMSQDFNPPLLMRIGLHSGVCQIQGVCQIEGENICSSVVDSASHFASAAHDGGILMSEDTYNALPLTSEIYCRFVKQAVLHDSQEPRNAYQAFWNPQEIERAIEPASEPEIKSASSGKPVQPLQITPVPSNTSGIHLVGGALALIGLVLALTLGTKFFGFSQSEENKRSVSDAISLPDTQNRHR